MSYVNLHASFPAPVKSLGVTEEEHAACLARNADATSSYEGALIRWKLKKRRYEASVALLNEWKRQAKIRGAKAASQGATYASRLTSYRTIHRNWKKAADKYKADLLYNKALHDDDAKQQSRVESKYGVKFPSQMVCINGSQKADMQRACDISQVKGLGWVFPSGQYPPCALAELNACRTRRTLVPPGPEPQPPEKPEPLPPMPAKPPVVPDPGAPTKKPTLETCEDPTRVGAFATFGLLGVLAVGGGVLGYRAWKKRKG